MTRQQRLRIPFVGIAITLVAMIVFVSVTAMEGGSEINIPIPGAPVWVGTLLAAIIGETARRLLRKLDDIGEKVDETAKTVDKNSSDFKQFRATVETVLMDVDGRGGILNDVRELQSHVFRDGGIAPRGVASPSSLQFPPQAKANA